MQDKAIFLVGQRDRNKKEQDMNASRANCRVMKVWEEESEFLNLKKTFAAAIKCISFKKKTQ